LGLVKLAFLSIKRKKLRSALLLLGIVISVGLITGVTAAVDGISKSYINSMLDTLGKTDLIVSDNDWRDFDFETVENSFSISGILDYVERFQRWTDGSTSENSTTSTPMNVVGIDPEKDEEYGQYTVIDGSIQSLSDGLSPTENICIISETFADSLGVGVDNYIYIYTWAYDPSTHAAEKTEHRFQITAVIRDLGKVYEFDPEDPSEFWQDKRVIFVHIDKAQEMFDTENVTQVLIDVADTYSTTEVENELKEILGAQFSVANLREHLSLRAEESVSHIGEATLPIIIIVVVLGVMLILNVMFINVTERKYEIGVLRSLGTSRFQVFKMFIFEGLLIGVFGAIGGVGFAVVASTLTASLLGGAVLQISESTALGFQFTPYHVLLGLLVGILFTTIASVAPAIFASKINLIEALRPSMRGFAKKRARSIVGVVSCIGLLVTGVFFIFTTMGGPTEEGPDPTGTIGFILTAFGLIWATGYFIKHLSWPFSRMVGKLGILVERNIVRNRRRSVFTYGMLTFCVAMILITGTIFSSMANATQISAKYDVGADISLNVSAPLEFENTIKSMSGVANCAGVMVNWDSDFSTDGTVLSDVDVRLLGINGANYFSVINEVRFSEIWDGLSENDVFDKISSERGYIILQDALLENIGLNLGDNITWITDNGSRMNFQIIAAANLISGAWETVWSTWALKYGKFVAVVSASDLTPFKGEFADVFYVSAEENEDTKTLANEIQALCQANGYAVEEIQTEVQKRESYETMFAQINNSFTIAILFIVLLSGLGVMVATVYTVIERRREIGVIRACGISTRQSIAIFTSESFVLALIGFCVGVAIGLPFAYLMINSITFSPVIPMEFVFPWGSIQFAFIACIVAASISTIYPAYKITKLKVTDSLRR